MKPTQDKSPTHKARPRLVKPRMGKEKACDIPSAIRDGLISPAAAIASIASR